MKHMDEDLNLARLLARLKEMNSIENIGLYYDPMTCYFYMNPTGVMPFWLPRGAIFIGNYLVQDVPSGINELLSYAVRQLTEEPKSEL